MIAEATTSTIKIIPPPIAISIMTCMSIGSDGGGDGGIVNVVVAVDVVAVVDAVEDIVVEVDVGVVVGAGGADTLTCEDADSKCPDT